MSEKYKQWLLMRWKSAKASDGRDGTTIQQVQQFWAGRIKDFNEVNNGR